MESRLCLKLGHVGKKSRSVGQIIENHIVHIRSQISFTPKVIKALWSRLQSFEVSKLYDKVFCVTCEAEARHVYCFSGVDVFGIIFVKLLHLGLEP